mgnify:CR=1 FL=1
MYYTLAAGSDLSADVVVVGAGPAGSAAAYHMAVAGLDVIVVERGEPGRDKVCGDGLTPSAVTELALMGGDMLAISGIDLLAAEGEGGGWVVSLDELRELSESGRRHF